MQPTIITLCRDDALL